MFSKLNIIKLFIRLFKSPEGNRFTKPIRIRLLMGLGKNPQGKLSTGSEGIEIKIREEYFLTFNSARSEYETRLVYFRIVQMRNNRSLSYIGTYGIQIISCWELFSGHAKYRSRGKFDTSDTSAQPGESRPASRKLDYRLK